MAVCRVSWRAVQLLGLLCVDSVMPFGRLQSLRSAPSKDKEARLLEVDESKWEGCKDEHSECTHWAKQGECEQNPHFMREGCKASCAMCQSKSCHDAHDECHQWAHELECKHNTAFMLEECRFSCKVCNVNFKEQCRRDPSMKPAAVPGTIDQTFRIALDRFQHYKPRVIQRDPWILHFEEFLSEKEVDGVIKSGGHHFERSLAGDGVTPVRTSATSWCNVQSCLQDGLIQEVRQRISNLTRVPWENAEHLQLLRYEKGQFYREHHDQNSPRYSAWGPRLYTFFMYLSDVEEGGETRFTHLNITVKPKKGSAILWPSVHDDDPFKTQDKTYHEAMTVIKGVKYSANFWIHMFEFQQALQQGCDNSDYLQNEMLEKLWPSPPGNADSAAVATHSATSQQR